MFLNKCVLFSFLVVVVTVVVDTFPSNSRNPREGRMYFIDDIDKMRKQTTESPTTVTLDNRFLVNIKSNCPKGTRLAPIGQCRETYM